MVSLISGITPTFHPTVSRPYVGSLAQERVMGGTLETYTSWGNIKTSLSAQAGMAAFGSDNSPLATFLLSLGALTLGEKIAQWYQDRLEQFSENHPQFADFRYEHPVMGNMLAWLPGGGLIAGLAGGAFLLGHQLVKHGSIRQVLDSTLVRMGGMALVFGALIYSSIWGVLGRKAVKEANDQGKTYKALKAQYPMLSERLTPKQLNQLAKTSRNRAYLVQKEAALEAQYQQDLNPFQLSSHDRYPYFQPKPVPAGVDKRTPLQPASQVA